MIGAASTLPSDSRSRGALITLFVTTLVAYTDRGALGVLVDPIRADLSISDTQIGALQGLGFGLVYAVAALPLGRLADLISARRMLIAAVLLWSAATLTCALAATYPQLFAARIAVAVGEASLIPATMILIAAHVPERRRGSAIGICAVGALVGAGLAFLLTSLVYNMLSSGALAWLPLIGKLSAWRGTLAMLGFLALPPALLLMRLPESNGSPAARARPGLSWREALQSVAGFRLALLFAGSALISVIDGVISTWAPTILSRRFGFTVVEIGTYLGIIAIIFGIGGALLGGFLADRYRMEERSASRARIAAAATVVAAFCTLFGVATSALLTYTLLALSMLTAYTAMTVVLTLQQEAFSMDARGAGTAINAFLCVAVGVNAGALLPGWLADRLLDGRADIGLASTCVALPALLGAALLFWSVPTPSTNSVAMRKKSA